MNHHADQPPEHPRVAPITYDEVMDALRAADRRLSTIGITNLLTEGWARITDVETVSRHLHRAHTRGHVDMRISDGGQMWALRPQETK